MSTQVRTQFRARFQPGTQVIVTDVHNPHVGERGRVRRLMYYEYDQKRGIYDGVYEVAVNGHTIELEDAQIERAR